MSSLTEVWKKWEGRVVNGKFPLRQWLGSSENSAVFLTERGANGSQKAAIKLIPVEAFSADTVDEAAQLAHWTDGAKLSHPHLIRLFESGRGKIDDRNFLYVVMEYAEENLAQILPQRPLSPAEVGDMLPPTAETLNFLHRAGLVHGHIKPANIMAVGNQLKISSDGLRKIGERDKPAPSAYIAPEVASTELSPAADVWSLGVMLVAVLTQHEPEIKRNNDGAVAIPQSLPQPFYVIAQRCLRFDPRKRCTVDEILGKPKAPENPPAKVVEKPELAKRRNVWLILPVVVAVLILAVWYGRKSHLPPDFSTTESSSPTTAPSAPPADKAPSAGMARGKVLQEVPADVSPGARRTITGHIKVGVQVSVDTAGNVSGATLVSPGPSKYFARQAMDAARGWKFTPPQINGQPASSQWLLRFQFGRTSTQVSPTETKP
jgi:TonB family protein